MAELAVIGCGRVPETRRPAARLRRHPPRLGRRARRACDANATCRSRSTCPGTARAPTRARPITFAGCVEHVLARRPSASRCAATRWAGASRCTSRSPRPSAWRGWCSCRATPGIEDAAERARAARGRPSARRASSKRDPFEEFIERWRAQPLFADDPPEVGELARADQRRNRPARAGRGAARPRHGRDGAAVGRLGELAMPVAVARGRARREVPRARPADGRAAAATARSLVVARAATACRSRAPARLAPRAAELERLDAEPGRRRARDRAVARRGSGSSRSREQPERRQAAVRQRAARGERGRGVQRRRDAERAVERRGEVDLGARGAHERGGGEQRARCRRSARSSGRPRRRRRRRARRARRRSRRSRRAPPRARAPARIAREAVHGLLDQLEARPARARRSPRTACSTFHAPLASRRSAHLRAGGGAHRRHAPGVVADADLQLQAAEARRARPRAACSAAPARSSGGERRVDRHLRARGRR